jgi:hypothetical protein
LKTFLNFTDSAVPGWMARRSNLPAVLFFAVYLLVGLLIYTDYGISFDENWGRENGIINTNYIVQTLAPSLLEGKNFCPACPKLENYSDADHGPVFEVATVFLEYAFGIKDMGDIFRLRHLCTFLLFYVSCICFYLLLQERFRKPLFSLAGVIMLVLSPRIFADSFYNAKDLPFLSLSIICGYTMIRFLNKPTLLTAFWHALACGLTLDIRILGLLFPVATVCFSLLDLSWFRQGGIPAKRAFLILAAFLALFAGFTIAFWPYLWEAPLERFVKVLVRSSSYPWKAHVLYNGEFMRATEIPWHYLPVWFFITTPLLYTGLFMVGIGYTAWNLVRSGFRFYRTAAERQDLVMAGLFIVPVAAAIILKLVLYDAWRHFFFIYAGFLYLAAVGLYNLYNSICQIENGKRRKLFLNLLFLGWVFPVGYLLFWMIKNHPYQHVYFSIYNTDRVRKKFELDYWGLSYKEGLEFVVQDSDKPLIKLYIPNLPGYLNSFMLPEEQKKRLTWVNDPAEADYFLTEYRWHPADFQLQDEVYQVKVDKIKILSVFKLRKRYKKIPYVDMYNF